MNNSSKIGDFHRFPIATFDYHRVFLYSCNRSYLSQGKKAALCAMRIVRKVDEIEDKFNGVSADLGQTPCVLWFLSGILLKMCSSQYWKPTTWKPIGGNMFFFLNKEGGPKANPSNRPEWGDYENACHV